MQIQTVDKPDEMSVCLWSFLLSSVKRGSIVRSIWRAVLETFEGRDMAELGSISGIGVDISEI